ncbi:MAG: DUF4399 domain-containing protein [Pseudomonadota bacterium]
MKVFSKPVLQTFGAWATLGAVLIAGPVTAGDTSRPDGASVYFINVKNGDTVASPVHLQFGLSGMGVAPAGVPNIPDTGHHHLIIDAELAGDALKLPVPADEKHRHFGKGQTEAKIELAPGEHTLQLVLGDWKHVPHIRPVMSERITITVK